MILPRSVSLLVLFCSACYCKNVSKIDTIKATNSFVFKGNDVSVVLGKYLSSDNKIETEDGYILNYIRVRLQNSDGTRAPVLIHHGLATSSDVFFNPDINSLAYTIADAGYDVWLANSRGTRYSRKHKRLSMEAQMNDSEYWKFSIHEMGVYDLSAAVDYILKKTGQPKVLIVGHSHGAVLPLILTSTRPQYLDKLEAVIALAPAVYLSSLQNPTEGPRASARSLLQSLERVAGTWSYIRQFEPAGTSTRAVHYLLQQVRNGPMFKQFDYGVEGNKIYYKRKDTPVYDLATFTVPMHIFYSPSDSFVSPKDISWLKAQLQNSYLHPVEAKNFNHFDFAWGQDAKGLVYTKVVGLLNKYLNLEQPSHQSQRLNKIRRKRSSFEKNDDNENLNKTKISNKVNLQKTARESKKYRKHLEELYKIKGIHGAKVDSNYLKYNNENKNYGQEISGQITTNKNGQTNSSDKRSGLINVSGEISRGTEGSGNSRLNIHGTRTTEETTHELITSVHYNNYSTNTGSIMEGTSNQIPINTNKLGNSNINYESNKVNNGSNYLPIGTLGPENGYITSKPGYVTKDPTQFPIGTEGHVTATVITNNLNKGNTEINSKQIITNINGHANSNDKTSSLTNVFGEVSRGTEGNGNSRFYRNGTRTTEGTTHESITSVHYNNYSTNTGSIMEGSSNQIPIPVKELGNDNINDELNKVNFGSNYLKIGTLGPENGYITSKPGYVTKDPTQFPTGTEGHVTATVITNGLNQDNTDTKSKQIITNINSHANSNYKTSSLTNVFGEVSRFTEGSGNSRLHRNGTRTTEGTKHESITSVHYNNNSTNTGSIMEGSSNQIPINTKELGNGNINYESNKLNNGSNYLPIGTLTPENGYITSKPGFVTKDPTPFPTSSEGHTNKNINSVLSNVTDSRISHSLSQDKTKRESQKYRKHLEDLFNITGISGAKEDTDYLKYTNVSNNNREGYSRQMTHDINSQLNSNINTSDFTNVSGDVSRGTEGSGNSRLLRNGTRTTEGTTHESITSMHYNNYSTNTGSVVEGSSNQIPIPVKDLENGNINDELKKVNPGSNYLPIGTLGPQNGYITSMPGYVTKDPTKFPTGTEGHVTETVITNNLNQDNTEKNSNQIITNINGKASSNDITSGLTNVFGDVSRGTEGSGNSRFYRNGTRTTEGITHESITSVHYNNYSTNTGSIMEGSSNQIPKNTNKLGNSNINDELKKVNPGSNYLKIGTLGPQNGYITSMPGYVTKDPTKFPTGTEGHVTETVITNNLNQDNTEKNSNQIITNINGRASSNDITSGLTNVFGDVSRGTEGSVNSRFYRNGTRTTEGTTHESITSVHYNNYSTNTGSIMEGSSNQIPIPVKELGNSNINDELKKVNPGSNYLKIGTLGPKNGYITSMPGYVTKDPTKFPTGTEGHVTETVITNNLNKDNTEKNSNQIITNINGQENSNDKTSSLTNVFGEVSRGTEGSGNSRLHRNETSTAEGTTHESITYVNHNNYSTTDVIKEPARIVVGKESRVNENTTSGSSRVTESSVTSSFVTGDEYSKILKQLKRYKSHIKSTYHINIDNLKNDVFGARTLEKLNTQVIHTKENCTGECREVRNLLKNVRRFRKHVNTMYLDG